MCYQFMVMYVFIVKQYAVYRSTCHGRAVIHRYFNDSCHTCGQVPLSERHSDLMDHFNGPFRPLLTLGLLAVVAM